jgi:hypothetical protein
MFTKRGGGKPLPREVQQRLLRIRPPVNNDLFILTRLLSQQ